MPKLIILSLRVRKRITSTTQRSEQFLFKQNYRKRKKQRKPSPHTNMLLRRLDLLFIDPKQSENYIIFLVDRSQEQILEGKKCLLKTNKTRNTTIKNNNRSGGDDEHWLALTRSRGDGRYNTLASGRNWMELLHMTEKHLKKNTKKTIEK
jgi:hypothetical protein